VLLYLLPQASFLQKHHELFSLANLAALVIPL
jgi:hypothetical protein